MQKMFFALTAIGVAAAVPIASKSADAASIPSAIAQISPDSSISLAGWDRRGHRYNSRYSYHRRHDHGRWR